MAFFTFTTVSGSAATNNLVISAKYAAGTTAVSVTLLNGQVAYQDQNGSWTSTGYSLDAFAPGGFPAGVTDSAGANTLAAGTTLAAFQTPGFVSKLNQTTALSSIDATGATSAQIDAFIVNHTGAPAGTLIEASLNAGQYVSLFGNGTTTNFLDAAGVVALDATGATSAQVTAVVNGMTAQTSPFATGAVDNLSVSIANFATVVDSTGADASGLFANGGALINAVGVTGATLSTDLGEVATYIEKVGSLTNLSISGATQLGEVLAVAPVVTPFGVTATVGTGLTTGNIASIIANRALFAPGSISAIDAAAISVSQFLAIPNKFVTGGVVPTNGTLSLALASSAQVDSIIANAGKLASATLSSAEISAAQFAALTSKLATGAATVDASGATAAETTAIINNLSKFANDGLTDLTLTPAQVNSLTGPVGTAGTQLALLAAATPATGANVLQIVGTSSFSLDASGILNGTNVTGSSSADSIQMGTTSVANGQIGATVQGGMGSDVIVGTAAADSLSGGNAADTIIGGAGADTITGGMSIAQQFFEGDTGNDRFVMNGGNNVIVDLGGTAGGDADIVINSSGVTTVANDVVSWTATASSSNSGSLTINTAGTGTSQAPNVVDAHLMVAASAITIVGGSGVDSILGTIANDVIRGGNGNDNLSGYLGQNTITGGSGIDTFTVVTGASDTITDLGKGGADVLTVQANATVNATVTTNWAAGAGSNAGTANIVVTNGVTSVDMTNSTSGGYSISASGNTVGVSITGAGGNDTLVGSSVADTLNGGNGTNKITGGLGGDVMNGGTGVDTIAYTAAGQTFTGLVANGTTILTGIDVVGTTTSLAAGDKIDLSAVAPTLAGTVQVGIAFLDGLTDSVAMVRGGYANGVFTAAANGADLLFQTDINGAAAGGIESVVLVGSAAGVTQATAAAGVFTLA